MEYLVETYDSKNKLRYTSFPERWHQKQWGEFLLFFPSFFQLSHASPTNPPSSNLHTQQNSLAPIRQRPRIPPQRQLQRSLHLRARILPQHHPRNPLDHRRPFERDRKSLSRRRSMHICGFDVHCIARGRDEFVDGKFCRRY